MIAYVDASVILRLALGQPNGLTEWSKVHRGVSSALITTESLRTLDRLRLRARLSDSEVATRRSAITTATPMPARAGRTFTVVSSMPPAEADIRKRRWHGRSDAR